jgi:predicted nuclease of predicted toxin-antitoxin system
VANPVRFYFDEHLAGLTVAALRTRGVDVLTADEAGTRTDPDDDQLRYATTAGRVVVTHDSDYLTLAADFQARGEPFAGVVYALPVRYSQNPALLANDLYILFRVLTADDLANTSSTCNGRTHRR